jgi:hypothetical protein
MLRTWKYVVLAARRALLAALDLIDHAGDTVGGNLALWVSHGYDSSWLLQRGSCHAGFGDRVAGTRSGCTE